MRLLVLRRCAAAAMSFGLWTTTSSVLAQVPEGGTAPDGSSADPFHPIAPAGATAQAVDVTIVAGGDDAGPLMDTIRELVGRLGLEVHPHFAAGVDREAGTGPASGLSVQIDLGSRYEAVLSVKSGRTEIRRSLPRDGSPAVVREEIGEAVRSTVESQLLSDESRPPRPAPAVAMAPPPSVAEAPHPATTPTGWFALDVTTFAGIGPVADGSGLVPHVGGGAVVGSRRGRRPSLTVTGAYLVPFETPPATVRARTTITALRAVAALEVWRTAGFALDLGAGGGIDVLEIDGTFGEKTTGILARSSTRADPILTALATGYVALTPGVALTFVAGAEWDVTPREYLVTGPGSGDQLALLAPWRVRPVALAGFTFTALGGGLFPGRSP